MTDAPLITVAIHTMHYACSLKNLLEKEGLKVTLQNVNLSNPEIAAGVRVRIRETDLPVALRIIENKEIFDASESASDNIQPNILVPVDFSERTMQACMAAFRLANAHNATITLLNSFVDPIYSRRSQLSDALTFDNDSAHDKATDMAMAEAEKNMSELELNLVSKIKTGEISPAKFTHEIREGIPEEIINQYARDKRPLLIVMGTRESNSKARELVGSVTAEVLDTCRFPVFTIPEICGNDFPDRVRNIIFFSNFDQQDILAVDALFRLLPANFYKVFLIKLPSKKYTGDIADSLNRLKEYCAAHYPAHEFHADSISLDSADDDFNRIISDYNIDLIAVPNKRKNVFARFFNPGVAHRLLFQSDIAMLSLPI